MLKLVGKQILDFVGKDGQPVNGIKLHFTDDTRSHVDGAAADTLFIRKGHDCYEKACGLPLGEFRIEFGFGGRILNVASVQK